MGLSCGFGGWHDVTDRIEVCAEFPEEGGEDDVRYRTFMILADHG
jgi:hypothetical protein